MLRLGRSIVEIAAEIILEGVAGFCFGLAALFCGAGVLLSTFARFVHRRSIEHAIFGEKK